MNASSPALLSKAPNMGTTIFTVMSALAAEKKAVNLGQGFPDFPCAPRLTELVGDAMGEGLNQYPPMPGVAPLREAVAAKIESLYGRRYNANTEITVTAGATQAILAIILAIVHPGDEVIVLEPCYDSYVPNIELAGGRVVRVPLTPALMMATSKRAPSTCQASPDALAASVTSMARARAPGCWATNASSAAALRADTHTTAPAWCKASAQARPMPLEAPINHTRWPRQDASVGFKAMGASGSG